MSALFSAMQAEFTSAFGSIYRDGTLYRSTQAHAEDGTVTQSQVIYPVKGMIDVVTEAMRSNSGYTEKDVQIILLNAGLEGVEINSDDELLLDGQRWTLANISADPVKAGWVMRGTPSG